MAALAAAAARLPAAAVLAQALAALAQALPAAALARAEWASAEPWSPVSAVEGGLRESEALGEGLPSAGRERRITACSTRQPTIAGALSLATREK